jgi:hypothetical protein
VRNKRNKLFAVLLFGVLVAVLLCALPALAEENLSGTTGPDDHAGLKGEYFDNLDFTNLKLTRTDPTVNFDWAAGSPDPSIGVDTFSVRWTGQVKADYSETYTFYATGNDYVRLYVNGQLVADKWATTLGTATGTIALQAGQWYDIKMEYGASLGNAAAKLEYSSTSESRKVIPQTQLRSPSLGDRATTYLSDHSWTSANNGWGPVEKDMSNGETAVGDGRTITLNGTTYNKGLGVHAISDIRYDLSGLNASTFAAKVGVDDEVGANGSVTFEVYTDGAKVYDSGVMTGSSATKDVSVNVSGKGELRLVVTTASDGDAYDHADWAGAKLLASEPPPPPPSPTGAVVAGELKKWHPLTISFAGPSSTETSNAPNPFLDYRLQVSFTSPSGKSFEVPGFYDGDGNGASSGSVWKVRFNPDESGTWGYKASFRQGTNVAIDTSAAAGVETSFDGASGTFNIAARDTSSPGFLSKGELEYVGGHYLKFRDGSYYLKGGADSPENWLGYAGFDNTPTAKHSFSPHTQDWQTGDPTFNTSSPDGGKGFIGALNYLGAQGINSIYFLPMNIGGDGRDSSPYVNVANWAGSTTNDNLHFDVSKLNQWEQAFAHAQKKGIMLHFVLNEAEPANKQELDNATLGTERKLFYREMVARFGHHNALQWNISEEYEYLYNLGSDNVKLFAGYIQQVDPYDHPITVHQLDRPDNTWIPFLGDSRFSVTSFQYGAIYAGYGDEVEEWRQRTVAAGRPLPIGMDEVITATTTNAADMRRGVLWPTYLSGGNLEWYIRAEDQSLEDFRRYSQLWTYTRYARTFMEANLPFWEMVPNDSILTGESTGFGGGQVFRKKGKVYAVYLPYATNSGTINIPTGTYEKRWFNPRSGAFEGSAQAVSGGAITSLGAPPSSASSDWVVLIEAIG